MLGPKLSNADNLTVIARDPGAGRERPTVAQSARIR
jgi:hypothetical protein